MVRKYSTFLPSNWTLIIAVIQRAWRNTESDGAKRTYDETLLSRTTLENPFIFGYLHRILTSQNLDLNSGISWVLEFHNLEGARKTLVWKTSGSATVVPQ